jgi:hypothetical protein
MGYVVLQPASCTACYGGGMGCACGCGGQCSAARVQGLGTISDTLSAVFLNDDGSVNLPVVGLVGVGVFFVGSWLLQGKRAVSSYRGRKRRRKGALSQLGGRSYSAKSGRWVS